MANRVEVPCLGKNIMCGFNAVACANMALAGFEGHPLDETIAAVYDVGLMLPSICAVPSEGSARPRPRSPSTKRLS